MQVLSRKRLVEFWTIHNQAETPLKTWYEIATKANWTSPADVKRTFGTSVDFVKDNRIIFDIGGNKYRLVTHMAYPYNRCLINFVGTHKEYDAIDPETV